MVLTLVEHDEGTVDDISLETVTFARDLASKTDSTLSAVAIGPGAAETAPDLGEFGVETVYAVEHDQLDAYAPVAWSKAVGETVDEVGPPSVVAPGTDRGTEVLAHLAMDLSVPMVAACTAVTVESRDEYRIVRQRWGGSLIEHARLSADPAVLTVVPHEIRAEPAAETQATVESIEPALPAEADAVRVERWEESDIEGVPLPEARVVVGGGRGVGGADGFDQLEELAELLNGAVGSSRAAVNEGWRPHSDQIGQTGAKISPELYIAAGISGAVQHWVGAKGSENVLAINTDPEAAIIQKADYAVIADLHEVVPALIEELKKRDM